MARNIRKESSRIAAGLRAIAQSAGSLCSVKGLMEFFWNPVKVILMNALMVGYMTKQIYKIEEGYVISKNRVWIPGLYESKEAAELAFEFPDEQLSCLQGEKRQEPITLGDLQKLIL